MEIQIKLPGKNAQEVKHALESQPGFSDSGTQLELRRKFRAIDPTLIAILGAAGSSLAALITGLFQLRGQIAAKKFVLETSGGQKLEVPANTPPEKIDHLLEKLKQMDDVKKISVE